MNIDLSGKNAFVCGSSKGIGQAIAIELSLLGANVTLAARNEGALQRSLELLDASAGQQHDTLLADFSDPEALKTSLKEHKTPVHILVNNTGGPPPGPAETADSTGFMAAFQQHLICNQILAQKFIPDMKSESYGRIINIISTSVKQPITGLGVSNTIRGAVANWAKTLAGELGPHGITVNNVLPGATDTERLSQIFENKSQKSGKSVDEVIEAEKNGIPARRFGKPQELAYAVAFLASPSAGYVNGINLPVDGGRTGCL